MCLFNKNSEKPQSMKKFKNSEKHKLEKNEINNKMLKEGLFSAAIDMLTEGEDYQQLVNTECEFGYLFDIEDHGLEALFKITTDKGTFYFAAQREALMRLNINEAYFQATKDSFLMLHS